MDERIGLAIIAGYEANALHRIEELDRSASLFAGQLTLWRFGTFFDSDHIAHNLKVAGRNLAAAIDQVEFEFLPFGQTFKAGAFDRADVHKHILAAAFLLNEAETLVRVEELHHAFAGSNDLGRHSAATAASTATTAAAEAAATTTAAEATAALAITTEAVSTAEPVSAAATAEGIKTFVAKSIALVAAPAAAPSIETHKPKRTFDSPLKNRPGSVDESRRSATESGKIPLRCTFGIDQKNGQREQNHAFALTSVQDCDISANLSLCLPMRRGLGTEGRNAPQELRAMFHQLSQGVFASPQIGLADLADAKSLGVALIINNRPEDESEDQVSGPAIAAAAQAAGIEYVAIPVTHAGFSENQVTAMVAALRDAKGPVLAYCRSGTRSTLLWALAEASAGGDPDALTQLAANAGYDINPVRPMMDMLKARA